MKKLSFASMMFAAALLLGGLPAQAGDINNPTHLTNSGNSAVNSVKARQFTGGNTVNAEGNSYDPTSGSLVHVGNARKGDCNMNVGGVKSGRETVVTARNIVNVCQ